MRNMAGNHQRDTERPSVCLASQHLQAGGGRAAINQKSDPELRHLNTGHHHEHNHTCHTHIPLSLPPSLTLSLSPSVNLFLSLSLSLSILLYSEMIMQVPYCTQTCSLPLYHLRLCLRLQYSVSDRSPHTAARKKNTSHIFLTKKKKKEKPL